MLEKFKYNISDFIFGGLSIVVLASICNSFYDISQVFFPFSFSFLCGTEDASDGGYPPGSKTSSTVTSQAPQTRKKSTPANLLDRTDKKSGQAIFRKLDRQKPTDRKSETGDDNHSDEKGYELGEK